MKSHQRITALWVVALSLAILGYGLPASAATITTSPTAPVVNDNDIANYGAVINSDKWWVGSYAGELTTVSAKGQSFLTGDGIVRLKSITYQTSASTQPSKDFTIRVGTISGNNFTQVYSETATQNSIWPAGNYVTWTFATPVLLNGSTAYGVDVHMDNSTLSYQVAGIPYLTYTANEYPLGGCYFSGTNGTGAGDNLIIPTTVDRVFHLDMEPPLDVTLYFVGGNPPDNEPAAVIRPEIVATFSQNLLVGSGNITIRNLTDAIDTVIPITGPGVVVTNNLLKISTTGRIVSGKSYAIRIAAGAILNQSSSSFGGINEDTTWNFTTGSDPLLLAVAALKAHINGSAPLSAAQISAYKVTIDQNLNRFPESAATVSNVCDLVRTYETVLGPLWVSRTLPARASVTNDIHWTIYTVMQNIVDTVYTPVTLAAFPSLLSGYKFNCSSNFPGDCAPPANPNNVYSVPISASYLNTRGPATQGDGPGTYARKPTGAYLAPGTIVTVTVPPALVNSGYKIRVGAHSSDFVNRPNMPRLDRSSILYSITSTNTKVASPLGGGIYIEVPFLASNGVVNVAITGAVRAPYFSAKTFHRTTAAEWLNERTNAAPWADFQSDKFMMQVPRSWIYAMPDPSLLMTNCDLAMDAMNDLMGYPRVRGKETMYPQVDLQFKNSVYAPGYPSVNNTYAPTVDYGGYLDNYLIRGPQFAPNYYFHEQGHGYFFPKFGGETESAVNLLHVAVWNQKFGYSLDEAFRASLGYANTYMTLDTTAMAWMCVFNFSPRKVPMAAGEKAYQLKGHAKFVEIARLYGWGALNAFWGSMVDDVENGNAVPAADDDKLFRICQVANKDLRPLFHFWGIYPQNPTALAAAIANANIPADTAIRDRLQYYKTIVPTNNAAFRTFATNWWGHQPSINGFWEEREHARQWDTNALYQAGDQQRSQITNPGEIYNEYSYSDITNRIQELIYLYFPGPVTPNPMTFAIAPTGVTTTSIGMVATTAAATVGPVQYYFENVTNGTFRTWSTSPMWNNTNLIAGSTNGYRVRARDGSTNVTDWSAIVVGVAGADVAAPVPNPMGFIVAPRATSISTVTMTASNALDVSGVEYSFENVTLPSHNSGWQSSPTYTDTNLVSQTSYTYRVRARDKSAAQNTTGYSASFTVVTDVTPPSPNPMAWATPPTALSSRWITMTAVTATDPAGVEYYFENVTTPGHDSGWQSSPTYIDTGLNPNTEYTYRVSARDKSPNANETDDSPNASATTQTSAVADLFAWDANNLNAGQTDGAGVWLGVNQWWNGTMNTNWSSGADVAFGNGGLGGAVTLTSPTTVNSITMNFFTGTYTLGSAGQPITINRGILRNFTAGNANIISPVTLGTNQQWLNFSPAALNVSGVVDDAGNGYGITVGGTGTLILSNANTYTGPTTVSSGVLRLATPTALPGGNDVSGGTSALVLNGGVVELNNADFQRNLGTNASQFQAPSGISGFSAGTVAARTVNVGGNANNDLAWGSATFNPTSLVLNQTGATMPLTLANRLDLKGAARSITVNANTATIAGDIRSSTGTGTLVKDGAGTLVLTNATSTYSGGTILNGGTLSISSDANLGDPSGDVIFNGNATLALTTGTTYSLAAGRNITINSGAEARFTSGNAPNFASRIFLGVLEGNGTIYFPGANVTATTFTFTNAANTFTGPVTTESVGSYGHTVEFVSLGDGPGAGLISLGNATFRWSKPIGGVTTFANRQFALSGNVTGGAISAENLTITKDLLITGTGNKVLSLLGANTGVNTFAGNIPDSVGGTLGVSKSGNGTWVLAGTNTYSGGTTFNSFNNGTLVFQGAAAVPTNTTFRMDLGCTLGLRSDASGTVNFGAPMPVNLISSSSGGRAINAINVSQASTGTNGVLALGKLNFHAVTDYRCAGYTVNVTGTNGYALQIASVDLSWGVNGSQNLTPTTAAIIIPGPVIQANGRPVTGTTVGAITLSATNGQMFVMDGTNAANVISGAIRDADDYTYTTNANAQPLSVSKVSSSTWTLSGSNTFSGGLTLNGAATNSQLNLNSPAALGLGTFTISGGNNARLDNTSGSSVVNVNSNAMTWNNDFVFLGSNSLNLGIGAVTMSGTRNLTVSSNSLTVGGAISASGSFGINKQGAGNLVLSGANLYTGPTVVAAGKLFINGDQTAASGAVSIAANATLGGVGVIGGNTTISNGARIEFTISTPAASHDKLDLATGCALTFAGGSTLTINSTNGTNGAVAGNYVLLTAPGGINGNAPTNVILPPGWVGTVSKSGNDLVLNLTAVSTGGYAGWSGGAPFYGDANNDGVGNGLAYVLGAANTSVTATNLLPVGDGKSDPNYYIYTCRRSDAALADPTTSFVTQYGSDLTGWTNTVPDGTNIIINVTDNFYAVSPGVDKVEIKVKRSLAVGGKLFVRLKVAPVP